MAVVPVPQDLPRTLGELRRSRFSPERLAHRSVKDEIRDNLICRLQRKEPLISRRGWFRRDRRATSSECDSFTA